MNNYIQIIVPGIFAIITSLISYLASRKSADIEIQKIREQNKNDLDRLMEQHKIDIDSLERKHQMDIEKIELDHRNQLAVLEQQSQNAMGEKVLEMIMNNPAVSEIVEDSLRHGAQEQKNSKSKKHR